MRLTLRTMLAYLDDILEPADAQELGKKIEESEFASGLVHRIRSSTRKLRLGAPKLEGKGMGLDPNTVAEYLDSTLSHDRVPDFEKVCLESDVHLAEVASCHQILALVLGEPADVRPESRERMYRIAERLAPAAPAAREQPAAPASTAPASHAAVVAERPAEPVAPPQTVAAQVEEKPEAEKVTRAKPELPDYLRAEAQQRRVMPLIVVAILVLLVGAVAVFAIGPDRIVALFRGAAVTEEGDQENGVKTPAAPEDGKSREPDTKPDAAAEKPPSDSTATEKPGEPTTPTTPAGSNNGNGTGQEPKPTEVPPPEPKPPVPMPGEEPKVTPAPVPGVEPAPGEAPPTEPAKPMKTETPTVAAEPPINVVDLGRFTSEKQILARLDARDGRWYRLPTSALVTSADRLFAPPTYRPQITLTSGIQLTVVGPTMMQFVPQQDAAVPLLNISYGRLTMVTFGKAGTQVAMQLGDHQGVVTFNADSAFAVEVLRYLPPGADPEKSEAHVVVNLLTTRGEMEWEENDAKITISEGVAYGLIDDAPGRVVKVDAFPDWLSSAAISGIDKTASEKLEPLVDTKRPFVVSLVERASDDHVELRSLAIRCGSYLDMQEAFVKMLGDASMKSFWPWNIDAVQEALARGPQAAAEVRVALEKLRGADAKILYRMLWAYDNEQLRLGAASQLVSYLENPSLDIRVLAFENLRRITGLTLTYSPERPESSRAPRVTRWRSEQLQGGLIQYKTPFLPASFANAILPPPEFKGARAVPPPTP